jgi:uncharacterized protein (TIGR02271 family)
MSDKDTYSREGNQSSRSIIIGAITGGVLGIILAVLYKSGVLTALVFETMFNIIEIDEFFLGIAIGVTAGILVSIVAELYKSKKIAAQYNSYDNMDKDSKATMQLREEKLHISKRKVQTGQVKIHKEVITEEKNISVPVRREELVVEKTILDSGKNSSQDSITETLRIPISEERIDISKHPVKLQEVSVHTDKIQETKSITEVLKKEVAHVEAKENAQIIDKETIEER